MNTFPPFRSASQESPAYWALDILWVVHATGEQTQGQRTQSSNSGCLRVQVRHRTCIRLRTRCSGLWKVR